MKIELNDLEPIERFDYEVVAQGGRRDENGNRILKKENLPIYLGSIKEHKIEGIECLVIASDLQGNVLQDDEPKLLGEVLPAFLQLLFEIEFEEINRDKVGVFLCGDLFARLDKRGGLGDVKNVWRAFNKYFGFVAGVAGNHDDFGQFKDFEAFKNEKGIHYLHNQIVKIENFKVGGIGGIIGRPDKPFRNEEEKHLNELKKLLAKQPHFILLHEGPSNKDPELPGNDKIRMLIERAQKNTVFCGHNYWDRSVVNKENGTQVINVDAKCIILQLER
jgi:Icc-related predicted phosphoesterase